MKPSVTYEILEEYDRWKNRQPYWKKWKGHITFHITKWKLSDFSPDIFDEYFDGEKVERKVPIEFVQYWRWRTKAPIYIVVGGLGLQALQLGLDVMMK